MQKTTDHHGEPRRTTRTPTRFEEDVQVIATTALADAKAALDRSRQAVALALRELKYLRDRGATGIN